MNVRGELLSRVEAITAAPGWQGNPANVAAVIESYRRSKWSIDHFAASSGIRVETLRQWNAGRGMSGREWLALVNALAAVGLKPSTRAMTREAQREAVTALNGPSDKRKQKTTAAFPGVEEVRMYRDQAGALHATPFDAHQANDRAERKKLADSAALWIGEQVAVDTIGLARALLSDEVAPTLWGIVQGRVAFAR